MSFGMTCGLLLQPAFGRKREHKVSLSVLKKTCKNNFEIFISAVFGWNQMLSEVRATLQLVAHVFFIHIDKRSQPYSA